MARTPTSQVFVAGKPGGYASLLARRARLRAAAAVAVLAGSLWFFVSRAELLSSGSASAFPVAGSLALASVCGMVARSSMGKAAAASVGARSERRVASALMQLQPVALLHSVDLAAGGDADHLVVGPKLVAVETKTGRGVVSYQDGKMFVNGKPMRGDPVAQCRRQALAAKSRFSSFCDAIVCVVDMENAPFQVSSVVVCSVHDLSSVFASLPDRVRPDVAWARAVELAPSCSTVHEPRTDAVPASAPPIASPVSSRSVRQPTPSPSPRDDRRSPRRGQGPTYRGDDHSKGKPSSAPPPNRKLTPRRQSPPEHR